MRPIDPAAAESLLAEQRWRQRYPVHLVHQEKLAAQDGAAATRIAAAGLAAVHETLEFIRDDAALPLKNAVEVAEPRFRTATIRGRSKDARTPLEIPYRGERLSGDALLRQLDHWCDLGIIEPSHAEAIRAVMRNPEWLDLSDQTFVLLGAGAEIGPLWFLAVHRANIVAVDLDREPTWRRIFDLVKRSSCALHAPVRGRYEADQPDRELARHAGADLLTETPELALWLAGFDQPAVVGCYAYLHGKDHVRVVAAMDALVQHMHAKSSRTGFAFLASATDAFAVSEDITRCAHERYQHRGARRLWQSPICRMTRERFYARNIAEEVISTTGARYGICDGLVTRQGPNYALAKRIQRWRALVARQMGRRTSANVAPPSVTGSVTSNRAFAAAYAGARHYGAEAFAPETTNALMGAMLVYDLRSESSVANPEIMLDHPLELFMHGANHGGLWRSPLQPRSVLDIAAVRGLFRAARI